MDHRVSKDMISSGMTPSGKKSQADLGKTQYGSAPSPSRLMDAYQSMYDKKEEVINEHHQKDENGNTIPHEDDVKEETDLFNTILNHFINEGYDEKDIISVMSNLSEEQLQSEDFGISAMLAGLAAKGAAAAGAAKAGGAALAAKGAATAGKIAGGAGKAFSKVKTIAGKGVNKVKAFAKKNPVVANNITNQVMASGSGEKEKVNKTGVAGGGSAGVYASADLFDIVKGQLLDEGLSEDEVRDIMLSLTPEEILKEIEESSLSAGSSGGHYSDGGDGVFRSKEDVGRKFNKNFPPAKNGKVDKRTRSAINTSARDFGIQGPTTLKQSVEPEGETI